MNNPANDSGGVTRSLPSLGGAGSIDTLSKGQPTYGDNPYAGYAPQISEQTNLHFQNSPKGQNFQDGQTGTAKLTPEQRLLALKTQARQQPKPQPTSNQAHQVPNPTWQPQVIQGGQPKTNQTGQFNIGQSQQPQGQQFYSGQTQGQQNNPYDGQSFHSGQTWQQNANNQTLQTNYSPKHASNQVYQGRVAWQPQNFASQDDSVQNFQNPQAVQYSPAVQQPFLGNQSQGGEPNQKQIGWQPQVIQGGQFNGVQAQARQFYDSQTQGQQEQVQNRPQSFNDHQISPEQSSKTNKAIDAIQNTARPFFRLIQGGKGGNQDKQDPGTGSNVVLKPTDVKMQNPSEAESCLLELRKVA